MNLLFVHSHKIRYINGKYYTPSWFNDKVLKRYTNVFDNMTAVLRVIRNETNISKYSEITNPSVAIKDNKEIGYKGLRDEIKKADCIIIRLPSVIGNQAVRLAKKYNKTFVVELVGCPWDTYWNHSWKGKIVALYMYLSTKNALANSAYAIYVTEQFLQKRYPCRGNTISCSNVALPCFDDENLSKRIEKIKNTKFEKNIVLGTTGAVNVKYKGQQYVIEAISKLNKQGFSFEYQIVGGGDNRYLKSVAQKYGVQDKVKFLGSLPHEEVFKWLDTIDIYVQPSKTEGLPRALIESMSRACPAVVSSAGGNSELIDKEFIFTNGSVEGLCKILNKINSYNLLQQAKRNYQFSKKFQTEILDERRTDFLFKIRSVIKERDLDNVELANDSD